MRAVATITVYVYGDSEKELIEQAKKLANELKNKYDNQAEVEKLERQEFGTLNTKEIKL